MSRSPRKLLQRAADAVGEFEAVLERYPEAEASVRAALSEEGLSEVRRAREVLVRAVERLARSAGPSGSYVTGAGDRGE